MKKIIFTLFLCLFAINVFCSDNDGRWWNGLSEIAKTYYIIGFSNAYNSRTEQIKLVVENLLDSLGEATKKELNDKETTKKIDENKKNIENIAIEFSKANDFYPFGYNYGEIQEFTDKFYENPQYKILRIEDVLNYVIFPALKEAWSKDDIDKRALEMLKWYKEKRQQIGYND